MSRLWSRLKVVAHFGTGVAMATKTVRRDSGNGQFISKKIADRKPANTWEKQHVKTGK